MIQVYVDMDGVLADFDGHAVELLGCSFQEYEDKSTGDNAWKDLWKADPDFYLNLKPYNDAHWMMDEIKKLVYPHVPKILTGCPKEEVSKIQKVTWAKVQFPDIQVITCKSREKCHYCAKGDVLIDDFLKYKHLWLGAGGHFIHHTQAMTSLERLEKYYGAA